MTLIGMGAAHGPRAWGTVRCKLALAGPSVIVLATWAMTMPASAMAEEIAAESSQGDSSAALSEIVVTAQRRAEHLTDVPYNISAVTPDALAASGTVSASDIGNVVVGLNTVNTAPVNQLGTNGYTLRGLRTDVAGATTYPQQTVNTVSAYFGDSPLFFSLLMTDLQRVEVLRGPQGTLYGSGAEGGTIRFIPNRPSFDKVSGEVNASTGKTYNAVNWNGSVAGVINLPVTEKLAARLVAAYNRQAGFIDKVDLFERGPDGVPVRTHPSDMTSGPVIAPVQRGANDSYQLLLRGAIRYQPTDWLDMELDYVHQKTHTDDSQFTNPSFPGGIVNFSFDPLTHTTLYPNGGFETRPGGKLKNTISQLEPVTAKLDLVSASVTADFDFASLTSVTTYARATTDSNRDTTDAYLSPTFSYIAYQYRGYPDFSSPGTAAALNKGFTEEVRLVSQPGKPVTYVLGGYYERRDFNFATFNVAPGLYAFADFVGQPGANPQLHDVSYTIDLRTHSSDIAGFGEITGHPTAQWQITGGFRVFRDKVRAFSYNTVPFFGAAFSDGVTQPLSLGASLVEQEQTISNHIFKLNTSYDVTSDTKLYATYSRGFRRGGANPVGSVGGFASLPRYESFQPDFADNYEIGYKGLVLDNRLTFSLSAYLINLKNFQVNSFTPSFLEVVLNGKLARSKGLESEISLRATRRLTLSAGFTYTDAKVVEGGTFVDLAPGALFINPGSPPTQVGTVIAAGARLPGVSRYSALGAADYRIPLGSESSMILHGNVNYRSSQHNTIDPTSGIFTIIPSNFSADARITYDSGNSWSTDLYVTNLTNSIGYTGAAGTQNVPYILQKWFVSVPRTAGVSLHYRF